MLLKTDLQIVRAMIDRLTTDLSPSHEADRALSVLFGWTKAADGKWTPPGWYHGKSVPMIRLSRHISDADIMADALFGDFAWTLSKPRLKATNVNQRYHAVVSRKTGPDDPVFLRQMHSATAATAAMALVAALLRAHVASVEARRDVIIDMYEIPTGKTPYEVAHAAGLSWQEWVAQPMADQIMLLGATNIPSPMPPWLRFARESASQGGA